MLTLEKAAFQRNVARFQREGEGRWVPSGTTAPSSTSPGVPVPSPLLLYVQPLTSPNSVLPPTQEPKPQPIPSPPLSCPLT